MIKDIFYKYNFIYLILALVGLSSGLMAYILHTQRGCKTPVPMVVFLDVGQGDSIYVQDGLGKTMLIDTGPKDSGVLTQIQKVTNCPTVNIDQLLLTHPDADHIGEAQRLIEKGIVGEVIHNGFMDVNQKDESATENRLEGLDIQRKLIRGGDILTLNNMQLEILFPSENLYLATSSQPKGKKKLDDNDFSIVAKLTISGTTTKTFLLTGDAPAKVEYELIKIYCPEKTACLILESNILKLGHHGSKNSTTQVFLGRVSPDEVVVSASRDNSYNHPHEETMNRVYEQRRKKPLMIRETSREGNIVFKL